VIAGEGSLEGRGEQIADADEQHQADGRNDEFLHVPVAFFSVEGLLEPGLRRRDSLPAVVFVFHWYLLEIL